MSKTNEELKTLKQECESFENKVQELTEDELNYVTGGSTPAGIIADVGLWRWYVDQLILVNYVEYKASNE